MTANVMTPPPKSRFSREPSLAGARLALILLLAINLFNYIDRYVLASVEPNIRRELLPNDPDAMAKTGLLSTAFFVTYMILAPVFGWLGDRMSRWKLVAIGVILWSLASGASGVSWHSGLSQAFWILLLTRCFVGVGEAAYGPVAPTLLSDLYPVERRGQILAWFYAAIPVGSALGYALGGQVASSALFAPYGGWRWAFYLVVPPGLLLGIWSFLMREPQRGQADRPLTLPSPPDGGGEGRVRGEGAIPRQARLKDYLALLQIPSYVLDTLGMTAMTFALGGLAYWMPAFLEQQGVHGLGLPGLSGEIDARTVFGGILAFAGLTGTLAGGILGDALRTRFPGSYFLVSGAGMIVGFPMIVLVLFTPFPLAWIFIFLAVFCLLFNTGPSNTILANVTPPAIRASAFALNIFIIHALGDVISPPIIGVIAGSFSLRLGFLVLSVLTLIGGVLWFLGVRYLAGDTELAPNRLTRSD
jgi:MFS family permease